MIFDASNTKGQRESVLELLSKNPNWNVLDVGGSMFPWARQYVTHYLDVLDPVEYHEDPFINDENLKRSTTIKGNICNPNIWQIVLTAARRLRRNTFDFAICTQTLEDIADPMLVLNMLPRVASRGYIDIPSKYQELCFYTEGYGEKEQNEWGLKGKYRGYMHHRWIFSIQEEKLILFPKLNFLEVMTGLEQFTLEEKNKYTNLSFFWENTLPFQVINDDWMGPNPPSVMGFYRENLLKGL